MRMYQMRNLRSTIHGKKILALVKGDGYNNVVLPTFVLPIVRHQGHGWTRDPNTVTPYYPDGPRRHRCSSVTRYQLLGRSRYRLGRDPKGAVLSHQSSGYVRLRAGAVTFVSGRYPRTATTWQSSCCSIPGSKTVFPEVTSFSPLTLLTAACCRRINWLVGRYQSMGIDRLCQLSS